MKNEIILFEDQNVKLEVNMASDTVWLNAEQMSQLFDRDYKTIRKHINNALHEELDSSTVAKFATVQKEGAREVTRNIEYYNLDVIISVGYRVKSKNGIIFRRWANKVLKDYLLKGYAVNQRRLDYLEKTVKLIDIAGRIDTELKGTEAQDIIKVINNMDIVSKLKFNSDSDLFALERNEGLKSIIGAIYQSYDGTDLYPTIEEKAANFLYLITKNHTFIDGNKRIAATLFIYFLEINDILYKDNRQVIDNNTLVALTLLIAQSNPKEKDILVDLVMNFLNED